MEYASTSEDEYGSNRHISKQGHTRPFLSTRVAQLGGSAPASPSPAGLAALKQHSREQDEYMRDWTAHSEEIARYEDLQRNLKRMMSHNNSVHISLLHLKVNSCLDGSLFLTNISLNKTRRKTGLTHIMW